MAMLGVISVLVCKIIRKTPIMTVSVTVLNVFDYLDREVGTCYAFRINEG